MQNRTLYFGDNLEILREKIPDESFDLIYLDPPFKSNRDYNVLFAEGLQENQAQIKAFEDSWHWTYEAEKTFEELIGVKTSKTKINQNISELMLALEKIIGRNDVLAYLTMMTIRLVELKRVLKQTGSLYLHCDPTASHYLKIVLDVIFGKKNFMNEIIWHYRRWTAPAKRFQKLHDVIFFYTKSDEYTFNTLFTPYTEGSVARKTGGILHRFKKGEEPVLVSEREISEKGVRENDVWHIPFVAPSAKERLGYPTQKPEALLERIIKASSNEGDCVLDPFCGCGTTVVVAERLNRKWVGIDITALAINLVKHRIRRQFAGKNIKIYVDGLPKDLTGARALAKKDPFEFEYWVCDLVNAMPAQSKTKENMRGADKGIDGIITFYKGEHNYGKVVVQIKSGNVQRSDIATLKSDTQREKADMGLFVTLGEPSQPMKSEAVSAGTFTLAFSKKEFPKIQIITIQKLLSGKQPDIPLLYSKSYYKEAKEDDIDEIEWRRKQFELKL